jgi:hypothetical protein
VSSQFKRDMTRFNKIISLTLEKENQDKTTEEMLVLLGKNNIKISESSYQRYLADREAIIYSFDELTYANIRGIVRRKAEEAHRKGGLKFFENNKPVKNEKGHFIGTVVSDVNNLEKKEIDIDMIKRLKEAHEDATLEEIATTYYSLTGNIITRDYVKDCLDVKRR